MSNVTGTIYEYTKSTGDKLQELINNAGIIEKIKNELNSPDYQNKTNIEKVDFLEKKENEMKNKIFENTQNISDIKRDNKELELERSITKIEKDDAIFDEVDIEIKIEDNTKLITIFTLENQSINHFIIIIQGMKESLKTDNTTTTITNDLNITDKIKLNNLKKAKSQLDDRIQLLTQLLNNTANTDIINPMLQSEQNTMQKIVNEITTLNETNIDQKLNSYSNLSDINKYINSQSFGNFTYIDTTLLNKFKKKYYSYLGKKFKSGVKGVLNLFGRKKGNKNKTPYAMSFNPSPTQAQRYIENKATVNTYFFPYENLKHPGLHSKIVVDVNYDSTNIDYMDIVDDILNTLRGDSSQLSQAEKITKTYRTRVPAD
jgi:hypothetical protein